MRAIELHCTYLFFGALGIFVAHPVRQVYSVRCLQALVEADSP